MFCEKCGQEIKNDDVFCPNCGTPVSDDGNKMGNTEEVKEIEESKSVKSKKSHKVLIGVGCAVVVAGIGFYALGASYPDTPLEWLQECADEDLCNSKGVGDGDDHEVWSNCYFYEEYNDAFTDYKKFNGTEFDKIVDDDSVFNELVFEYWWDDNGYPRAEEIPAPYGSDDTYDAFSFYFIDGEKFKFDEIHDMSSNYWLKCPEFAMVVKVDEVLYQEPSYAEVTATEFTSKQQVQLMIHLNGAEELEEGDTFYFYGKNEESRMTYDFSNSSTVVFGNFVPVEDASLLFTVDCADLVDLSEIPAEEWEPVAEERKDL